MRPPSALRKPPMSHLCWTAAALQCEARPRGHQGGADLSGHLGRLVPVIGLFMMFACTASAESAAETASKWGLIGRWSFDCSLPPDRDRGAVLAYEIASDGRLLLRRDFGDQTDSAEVIAAKISADGVLNLRVFFPKLKQTREYGLKREPDGSIRAIYNRDKNGNYSIRDGTFAASGQPTPPQYRCEQGTRARLRSRRDTQFATAAHLSVGGSGEQSPQVAYR